MHTYIHRYIHTYIHTFIQLHSTLLNSTLSDGVGVRGRTNTTCCTVQTRCSCLREDLLWMRKCYNVEARGHKSATLLVTRGQKKCWANFQKMEIKLSSTSYNIMQYDATSWQNEFNMLHSTMLNYVESWHCISLAKALGLGLLSLLLPN